MGRTEHADVDAYVAGQPEPLVDVVRRLRSLVREEAPDAVVESIKWGHPNWEIDGNVCYVSAFTEHVNLGFFRGAELEDPDGLLEGTGKNLRHVKVRPDGELPVAGVRELLREAFEL